MRQFLVLTISPLSLVPGSQVVSNWENQVTSTPFTISLLLARDFVMVIFLIISLFWLSAISTNILWLCYISPKIQAISRGCFHLDSCSIYSDMDNFIFQFVSYMYVLEIVSLYGCGT